MPARVSQHAEVALRAFEGEQMALGIFGLTLYSDQPHCLSAFRASGGERLLDAKWVHVGLRQGCGQAGVEASRSLLATQASFLSLPFRPPSLIQGSGRNDEFVAAYRLHATDFAAVLVCHDDLAADLVRDLLRHGARGFGIRQIETINGLVRSWDIGAPVALGREHDRALNHRRLGQSRCR
jgi:hypothetical protein